MNTELVYSIAEAASQAKIGRTSLCAAISTGALRAVKRGNRTLILGDDLRRWLESLPAVPARIKAGQGKGPSHGQDH